MSEEIIKAEEKAKEPTENSAEKTEDKKAEASLKASVKAINLKEIFSFTATNKDTAFAAVFIVGTFIGVSWGLSGGFRLGFSLAHIAAFAAGSIYFAKKGTKPGAYGIVCGVLSLLSAVPCAVTSDFTVRAFSVIAAVALEWVWFASLSGKEKTSGDLGLVELLLGCFFHGISDMPASLKTIVKGEGSENKKAVKGIAGVLCAIPVLCIVIPLLVKSDAAFEGLVSSFIPEPASLVGELIATVFIAPFIIGFAFSLRYRKKTALSFRTPKGIDTAFLSAFFGVLSLCYLVYLFSQTAYFFSAFSGLLPEGYKFTFADYARRGFFELCYIAGINLVLIFLMIILAKKKDEKLPAVLKGFGCFIGVFTLAVIATALSKMVMYIDNYGMTVLRIGTSSFMVFMAVVFAAVIIRCFTDKVKILQTALITASVIIIALGAVNIKAVSAKYNYNAYVSGKLKTIDTEYLSSLGEEGVPYLIKLLDDKDNSDMAKINLYNTVIDLYGIGECEKCDYVPGEKYYPRFTQSGVSRKIAYSELDKLFEKDKLIFADIFELESKYYDDDDLFEW